MLFILPHKHERNVLRSGPDKVNVPVKDVLLMIQSCKDPHIHDMTQQNSLQTQNAGGGGDKKNAKCRGGGGGIKSLNVLLTQ